ncbi:protein angel homolog 2-like [Panonychus citri]|uniref:protein angel homolog 2-like n=1 Tax=Panonychus citri TaxID=50023 RepID=UPI0023070269|nr:protein angel homolog 2-like [Panonychus citri]
MLKVPHRILLLIKKCFSSDMLQDYYNINRPWCYTNSGRIRQKDNLKSKDERVNNGTNSRLKRDQSKSTNGQFEFSLMTFNCLSQDLIARHTEMYVNCPRGSLDWPLRRDRLARELSDSNPDIVCLQEVNYGHHGQFYKPFFTSLGYSGIYKKRTGSMYDGCAFFYKTSKFTLLDKIELEFYRCDLTSLLNRDNIAIIGVLKPLIQSSNGTNGLDSNRLIVATTHLLFNPSRGDVKLAQLRLLLAELDQLINSFNETGKYKTNVILCGDMNSVPYSPLYNFITTGSLDTSGYQCGDLSGQLEGTGHGKLFRPSDLKLEGINHLTRYVSNQNEKQSNVNNGRKDNWRDNNTVKSKNEKYTRKDFLKTNDIDERTDQNSQLIKHNFKFSSVYPATDVNNLPFITTHHGTGSCMVDYIFYNRSDSLELLGYTRLLNSEQMARIGCLPNLFIGSDHLSLQAKFLIKG